MGLVKMILFIVQYFNQPVRDPMEGAVAKEYNNVSGS